MNKKISISKTILLVNPRTPDGCGKSYYLPLGLLYLASVCEKAGFSPHLLDFNIFKPYVHEYPDEWCNQLMVENIKIHRPDIILLGCLFSGQFPQVLELSSVIKYISPHIQTILGGIHATTYPNEILSYCNNIDYIILGEGEQTLGLLLTQLQSGNSNYQNLDGFAFRNNSGSITVNKKTRFTENLDKILLPAYHLIRLSDYHVNTTSWHNPKQLPIYASIPIITSRGCPMQCSFCPMSSVMGKTYRQRSIENVFSEIMLLYKTYGYSYFSFMDDNFTLRKEYVLRLCQLIIANHINIQFDMLNGIAVNTLDEEVIDSLVKAGMVRIGLAIESGAPEIRKCMGKQLSQNKIFEVVEIFKKHPSVKVRGFFIIGIPEETNDTLTETYDMIKRININSPEVNILIPFQGTKIFDQALRDNLFIDKINFKDLWKTPISFTNNNTFYIKPYSMTLNELNNWRLKFNNLVGLYT